MKLYIKANKIKILKNIDTLLPHALSKTNALRDKDTHHDYVANIQSAMELQKHQKTLFYETRELSKLVKGVYFGNSSCEHLLAPVKEIAEAREFCQERHFNFVFVFPPLSQGKIEDARYICEMLSREKGCEVVANDIGVLQMILEYKTLKPILGLNFTKVIKNAFLDSMPQSDISKTQLSNQKELLSHIEFENSELREFYKSLGVGRFTLENIESDMSFMGDAPKMQVDFYYPHVTISNSRACDIAGCFEDERAYFAYDDCSKFCNFASLEFTHSDVLGLRQRYNTIYKTNISLDVPKEVYKNDRNRLVWELFL
jgi:hypothetical protein